MKNKDLIKEAKALNKKDTKRRSGSAARKNIVAPDSIITEIRQHRYYKENIGKRQRYAVKMLTESCDNIKHKLIKPGQLIFFEYDRPKLMEELEYYDARPLTIFFGSYQTENYGKLELGFNLHYFPPFMRFRIMEKIYQIFKGSLKGGKGLEEVEGINYHQLIDDITNAGLNFGIRSYYPLLRGNTYVVTVDKWNVAAFTEGIFEKKTRDQILTYWRTYRKSSNKKGIDKKK